MDTFNSFSAYGFISKKYLEQEVNLLAKNRESRF